LPWRATALWRSFFRSPPGKKKKGRKRHSISCVCAGSSGKEKEEGEKREMLFASWKRLAGLTTCPMERNARCEKKEEEGEKREKEGGEGGTTRFLFQVFSNKRAEKGKREKPSRASKGRSSKKLLLPEKREGQKEKALFQFLFSARKIEWGKGKKLLRGKRGGNTNETAFSPRRPLLLLAPGPEKEGGGRGEKKRKEREEGNTITVLQENKTLLLLLRRSHRRVGKGEEEKRRYCKNDFSFFNISYHLRGRRRKEEILL